jgi:4-diphosphocytidyl-2-C-methyl-D-erythritol kinase
VATHHRAGSPGRLESQSHFERKEVLEYDETVTKILVVQAFAKLNLGLRVLGRRPDGYHEIETLFQSIDLHDTLTLEPLAKSGIELKITSPWALPEGQENLVYRAAGLLAAKLPQGVRILLEKRIPVGAGVGGGSSDAAATLVGLNELFQLELSDADLHVLACKLGSDVPYFLRGGLCRGRRRGEMLEKLSPRLQGYSFLLVKPLCSLSTEAVYAEYDLLVGQGWRPPKAQFFYGIDCANDLEEAATRLCPELRECRRVLAELKPDLLGMSGSGPTYYAGWRRGEALDVNASPLLQRGYTVYGARPVARGYGLAEKADAP